MSAAESVEACMERAVLEGKEDEVSAIIRSHGLNHCAEWLGGYRLLTNAIKHNQILVACRLLMHDCRVTIENGTISEPLHLSIEKNIPRLTLALFDKNASPRTTNERGSSTLHTCAEFNRTDFARSLLEGGLFVDLQNNNGETALFTAARNKSLETASLLLEFKSSVNKTCNRLNTPLHLAAENGDHAMVNLLISKGALINAINRNKETPLSLAILSSCDKTIKVLIKAGGFTPLEHRARWAKSLLRLAVIFGDIKMVERILNSDTDIFINTTTSDGLTPLHIAVRNDNVKICRLLLTFGANINGVDSNGDSPLHYATRDNLKDMVEKLLNSGANVNIKNKKGVTCLHLSTLNMNEEISELLLKRGTNTSAVDVDGVCALHLAVKKRSFVIVKLLLDHKADVNQKCTRMNTSPISIAAEMGDEQMFNLLLQNGAQLDIDVKKGDLTILHKAMAGSNPLIVKHIMKHCKAVPEQFKGLLRTAATAKTSKSARIVKSLLHQGFPICDGDLCSAVIAGNEEVIEILLQWGANDRSKGVQGTTALFMAVLNKSKAILEMLFSYGDIFIQQDVRNILNWVAVQKDPNIYQLMLDNTSHIRTDKADFLRWFSCIEARIDCTCTVSSRSGGICLMCSQIEPMKKILQQHLVKLRVSNLNLDAVADLPSDLIAKDYEEKCQIEVAKLMSDTVGNSSIYYYDILMSTLSQLVTYLRDENFRTAIRTGAWLEEYPIYERILCSKLAAAEYVRKAMDEFQDIFSDAFPTLQVCVDKITSYFKIDELRRIVAACQPESEH